MGSTKGTYDLFLESLKGLLTPQAEGLRVVAALSGGPDSTALVCLLKEAQGLFGYTLEVAYVDHALRAEAERAEERAWVEELCQSLGLFLHRKTFDPGFLVFYSKRKACGIEAAARTCRYHFLSSLCREGRQTLIALGHNQNDHAETILMRLLGSAGLEGLRGIPLRRGSLIRPLLAISRQEIEFYLAGRDLKGVEDRSNWETKYLRNRLRRHLIPPVRELFPGALNALGGFSRSLGAVLDHYKTLLDQVCPWEKCGEAYRCREEAFWALPGEGRFLHLLPRINEVLKGEEQGRIPRSFFNPLWKGKPQGEFILKGHGFIFWREGLWLWLGKEAPSRIWRSQIIRPQNPCRLGELSLTILPAREGEGLLLGGPELLLYSPLGRSGGGYELWEGKILRGELSPQGEVLFQKPGLGNWVLQIHRKELKG